MKRAGVLILTLLIATLMASAQKIYWGDSVPKGWNGKWPARLLTVPEKTSFERTALTVDVLSESVRGGCASRAAGVVTGV